MSETRTEFTDKLYAQRLQPQSLEYSLTPNASNNINNVPQYLCACSYSIVPRTSTLLLSNTHTVHTSKFTVNKYTQYKMNSLHCTPCTHIPGTCILYTQYLLYLYIRGTPCIQYQQYRVFCVYQREVLFVPTTSSTLYTLY